ncbi:MAG TPA: FixH family protein [Kofleriaceae bacterium]|jgi:nitrogen fixation protein FixH
MTASVKWTIAIVGLLMGNVVATVVLATVANAGKSQVIPDYYDHAAHFDDAIDEAAESAKLGWRVTASIVDGAAEVRAVDAQGMPILGAVVRCSGYPRAHADHTFDISLPATASGLYRAHVQDVSAGRYDLRVVLDRGRDHFGTTFTVDTIARTESAR